SRRAGLRRGAPRRPPWPAALRRDLRGAQRLRGRAPARGRERALAADLERSLEFLRRQHAETLQQLHDEVDRLKRQNRGERRARARARWAGGEGPGLSGWAALPRRDALLPGRGRELNRAGPSAHGVGKPRRPVSRPPSPGEAPRTEAPARALRGRPGGRPLRKGAREASWAARAPVTRAQIGAAASGPAPFPRGPGTRGLLGACPGVEEQQRPPLCEDLWPRCAGGPRLARGLVLHGGGGEWPSAQ
uniref:CCDC92/74 N-terminal domain-containing protein n=1 Tax=Varanus komodoensis TaxID=61221 RepID=A0A8D2J7H0_VARKO